MGVGFVPVCLASRMSAHVRLGSRSMHLMTGGDMTPRGRHPLRVVSLMRARVEVTCLDHHYCQCQEGLEKKNKYGDCLTMGYT